MLSFKNTIRIERPLYEVFKFVSDQRNNPKWNYYVTHVEKLDDLVGGGTEYLQTRKTDQQKFKVVEYRINELIVVQTLPGERPSVKRTMMFEGDDQQSVIYDQMEFNLPLPKFLSGMILRGPQKAVNENLGKLKILMETGHVVLQNGESSTYHS